jgi:hypothetical protein
MLYAKINPTAKVVKADSPFNTITLEAEYMTAFARPYGLGSENVRFEVVFGNIKEFEDGTKRLEALTASQTSLTKEQIEDWGVDDSVVLQEIATVLGTTVVSVIELPDTNFF